VKETPFGSVNTSTDVRGGGSPGRPEGGIVWGEGETRGEEEGWLEEEGTVTGTEEERAARETEECVSGALPPVAADGRREEGGESVGFT
jgi:hypothetical protein